MNWSDLAAGVALLLIGVSIGVWASAALERTTRDRYGTMTISRTIPGMAVDADAPPEEIREQIREHLETHAPGMSAEELEYVVGQVQQDVYEMQAAEQLRDITPQDFEDERRGRW